MQARRGFDVAQGTVRFANAFLIFALSGGALVFPDAASAATADPAACMGDLFGGALNCVAEDVDIATTSVGAIPDPCEFEGDTTQFELTAQLALNASERYDVGVYLARDGGNAQTGECRIDTLPTGSPAVDIDEDSCGDMNTAVSPMSISLGLVTATCVDDDHNGKLDLSSCLSWRQNEKDECNSPLEAFPGTPSKCKCEVLQVDVPVPPAECENNTDCEDGNVCNGTEACVAGECVLDDPAPNCNDDNACTADSCNPASGCVNTDTTFQCGDDDACTNDSCDPATGCVNSAIACDDSNACTTDSCDAETGCSNATIDCDDGDACTSDSCNPDTGCVNDTVSCNDGDACTTDGCDPATGCTNGSVTCDDQNACTTDGCDPEEGCTTTAVDCNDQNACTTDGCDPQTGCTATPVVCDDQNACTTDSCDQATGCTTAAVDCNDANACTADSCDPTSGCVNTDITASCDDQNACTADSCNVQFGCVNDDITASCDDQNACTADSCDPASGCVNTDTSASCDDQNACTADSCDPATGCVNADISESCDDQSACTTDACDPANGCSNTSISCDDQNACTSDTCDAEIGCTHAAVDCNDNDACTTDSCDPTTGCDSEPVNCDDQVPCTDDDCDPQTGCENVFDPTNEGGTCELEVCRTPGFWKTHDQVTLQVIGTAGCFEICGEVIDDVTVASADSALEALCIKTKGDKKLHLVRDLTAAALNCVMSSGTPSDSAAECSGTSIEALFAACNTACATNDFSLISLDSCQAQIDCFNNGGVFDLATNTCGAAPEGTSCHEQPLVNDDLGLDFDPPGAATSAKTCGTASGNSCTVIPPNEIAGAKNCSAGGTVSAEPEICGAQEAPPAESTPPAPTPTPKPKKTKKPK